MAYIYISKPDGSKNKYRLPNNESTRVDIGRGDDCLISLPDVVGVSGLHCSISYANGYYYIKDENSSNGTIVDGQPITQVPLYEEKSYHIGAGILTFFAEGAVPPPAAAEPAKSNFATEDGKIKATGKTPERKYANTEKPSAAEKLFPLYVIIVCIISLLAGITLRHWKETGKYDPAPFANEEKAAPEAPAASKPAKATAKPAAEAKPAPAAKAKAPEPAPAAEEAAPAAEEPAPVEEETEVEEELIEEIDPMEDDSFEDEVSLDEEEEGEL